MNTTVARLTLRGLLGRRRAALLVILPLLLIGISVVVRMLIDTNLSLGVDFLSGFAIALMIPLVGVIAGTGAINTEIDDGSIIYLLAKPLSRTRIVLTKLAVAIGCMVVFAAVPVFLAALVVVGTREGIAVGYGIAALVASLAYGALFLLLGVVTRHAVVIGLVYALVWEGVFGSLVPGVKSVSVQQWALSFAERIAAEGTVYSAVGLPAGAVLIVVLSGGATWIAAQRLRSLTLAGGD